ncbi:cytidylyltransferase domain-containing protein [Halalkalibacterium ligniniphilum]|uniref:cytidylyltransferase domain-containing protein n=1 Tax=Halalkalibacterium ligniniphilum TaxID=1134413 RepID=UPI00034A709E|nr:glycosyltransferase family protein [Halalkalibacterium ligniniphilum]
MKVVAIIQARMGSTRLPGKVLKAVMGKPLLAYQLDRLLKAESVDEIVIATTNQKADDPIVAFCKEKGIPYYRGSEMDVLSRYYEAAKKYQADAIVRMTSDCPIIDPSVVEEVIAVYKTGVYEYVSNTLERSFPRGMDTEIFSMAILKKAYDEADQPFEREHVTPYFYLHQSLFKLGNVCCKHGDMSEHRWTVDTEEDFALIKTIIEQLYPRNPHFTLEETLALVEAHPEWSKINAHIEQKKLEVQK